MKHTRRSFLRNVGLFGLACYLRLAPEKVIAARIQAPEVVIESRMLPRVLTELLAAGRSLDVFQTIDWPTIHKMTEYEIGDWIFRSRVA